MPQTKESEEIYTDEQGMKKIEDDLTLSADELADLYRETDEPAQNLLQLWAGDASKEFSSLTEMILHNITEVNSRYAKLAELMFQTTAERSQIDQEAADSTGGQ